jgi:hypothetical protein
MTVPPAVVLPDSSGVTVACASNTLRLPLTRSPGGRIGAVSRIEASGDTLFLLIDGGLYQMDRLTADAGAPQLLPVLLPGDRVATRPVQELSDLAVDAGTGLVYVLDKAGNVFRYEAATKLTAISYNANPQADYDNDLPPQIDAITLDAAGRLILLNTAHGALWTPEGIGALAVVNEARRLEQGVDVTAADGRLYALRYDGSMVTITDELGSDMWREPDPGGLGLALKTSTHFGGLEMIYVVDGLRREVVGMLPSGDQPVIRYAFAFPDLGLLRDAAFAGGRLYAVADDQLLVFPGLVNDSGATACPPPSAGSYMRPRLYGIDVIAALHGTTFPIEGATLPPWPRAYPGASRLYRLGVHQGLDIFAYNAPPGFGIGWPVLALAAGKVERSILTYIEMSDEEFDQMTAQAQALGQTPPDILERLSGRQVILDHGQGIRSVYSHLDEVAPGVVAGAQVQAGQLIGTVGVTGTQGEARPGTVGPHLHFEIWLGERYLGQGITLRETMWWYAQIYGPPENE